jgi:hypothetical protein
MLETKFRTCTKQLAELIDLTPRENKLFSKNICSYFNYFVMKKQTSMKVN